MAAAESCQRGSRGNFTASNSPGFAAITATSQRRRAVRSLPTICDCIDELSRLDSLQHKLGAVVLLALLVALAIGLTLLA